MYIFETSKDNRKILKKVLNGKEKYIGSYYNHNRDIEEFLNKVGELNNNSLVITYGLADGEHILELAKNKVDKSKLLIFEKSDDIINRILTDKYYEIINSDRNIHIVKYSENNINKILWDIINDGNIGYIKYIDYKILEKENPDENLIISKKVTEVMKAKIIENNTVRYFSKKWFMTFIENLKYVKHSTFSQDLKDKMKNKPAIIVSAGPSLEKNIHLLKECKDDFFIITGGRTLKSLINIGVKPDLIAAIDGEETTYELVKEHIHLGIPLLFNNGTNEKILINHKGKKIYDPALMDFVEHSLGHKMAAISGGGSVAHACTGIAAYMGCNPIVFIGQDLAYTNDKVHASIAEVKGSDKEKIENNKGKYDLYVDDIYGNKVKTSAVLNGFRLNLEVIIEEYEYIKFINATEGGARINGADTIPLKEVIEKYSQKKMDKTFELVESLNSNEKDKVDESFNASINCLRKIRENCKQCVKLNEQLKVAFINKNYSKYNNLSRKLDVLEDDIKEQYESVNYITSLIYPIVGKSLGYKKWHILGNENEKEYFDKLYERTKYLYSELINEIEYALNYLEDRNEDI